MNYVDQRLRDILRWERHPKGEVGLEIEVEGRRLPPEVNGNWAIHADGSLRNGGLEYVVAQPINRDNVLATLEGLAKQFADAKAEPTFTMRTSVHAHINIQDMTVRQWVNFVCLFGILEIPLVNVVGPDRAGNKFCLRFRDADAPLRAIRLGLNSGDLRTQIRGDYKYASCNIRATSTHGTLEFRAMEGNLDPALINDWVQLLCALKDHARAANAPHIFVEELSVLGPIGFARKYLPAANQITKRVLATNPDTLHDTMYEGVRVIQDVAYCTEWGEPQEFVGPAKKAKTPSFEDDLRADLNWPRFGVNDLVPAPRPRARAARLVNGAPVENQAVWVNNPWIVNHDD